ncbi:MAG: FHA domain-containing protein [Myxococcota bacterium]
MKAWFERVEPAGDVITLPEGSGSLVLGRSPKATIVFDDLTLSARHCEIAWDQGFWRVRDLGTDAGTRVNGQPLTTVRALFPGDIVQLGATRLRFHNDAPPDDPILLDAIAARPEEIEPWLVYADQLQERGDPLGERIARARVGDRLDHLPWLGPLWDTFVSGALEVDWHLGFARRATLRTVAGRLPIDWRAAVTSLFNLRIGRFVRELAVDVPRLDSVRTPQVPEAIVEAQRFLASIPALPSTMERVSLGYQIAQPTGSIAVVDELAQRVPRLLGGEVYRRWNAARLTLVWQADGSRLTGLHDGRRSLTGVLRLRKGLKGQLHLESPPGIPFLADGNPCYVAFNDGRVQLIAGRMRGELRVNHRIDALYELLPGDLIELQGLARFRFEVTG